ncbi:MAG: hypothetical protein ACLPYW_06065 [Acidimicrobiales bacterium]
MSHVDSGVVALGAFLALTFGAGAWRAGSLRSDIVEKYQPRVNLAQSGLDEKARVSLQRLAVRVSFALGGLDADFSPSDAIADPGELLDLVDSVAGALKARARLPKYFQRLLLIGPVLVGLLAGTVASVVVTFAYFSGWSRLRVMGLIGLYVTIALVIGLCLASATYFVLLHLFSSAEILATKDA